MISIRVTLAIPIMSKSLGNSVALLLASLLDSCYSKDHEISCPGCFFYERCCWKASGNTGTGVCLCGTSGRESSCF